MRGTNAWYLGPSEDHYRCNLYYVPETRAYQVAGSAKLFLQHCQVPNLTNTAHLKALTKELTTTTAIEAKTHKGRTFIQKLKIAIDDLLTADVGSKQKVGMNSMTASPKMAQVGRLIERITMVPPIMKMRDPMAKRNLIKMTHTHQRKTRCNTPGAIPAITRDIPAVISPNNGTPSTRRKLTRVRTHTTDLTINFTPVPIIIPPYQVPRIQASARLVSQQALNAMTIREAINAPAVFTPRHFVRKAYEDHIPNYAHFMVHPNTGETITSYKRLMNDPKTAEIWQTAFGKDFGRMAQGDDKTGQVGTHIVFVMTHGEIDIAMKVGHK